MCENNGRFYGVYLLCSASKERHYRGKCYIGFTVNPERRINQHNRGKEFGGAKKTNNKGPWQMVLVVHGFPNNIAALQFEWAWQKPALSSRLKAFSELKQKRAKETHFQYNLRILSRMLLVGPWTRLPLIIRWLQPEYECDFESTTLPPKHMEIVSGKIPIKKTPTFSEEQTHTYCTTECHLCMQNIVDPLHSRIGCLNKQCKLACHLICLANHMLAMEVSNRGHYIPIVGECPLCEMKLTWTELWQRRQQVQGMAAIEDNNDDDELDFDYGSDDDDVEENDDVQIAINDVYELSD